MIKLEKRNSKDYKKYPYKITSNEWIYNLMVTKQELLSLYKKIGKALNIRDYKKEVKKKLID